ncbi:MAG: LysM peptidoglycan-binding domain-containing protein [Planctomycetota bacterium]|jgi:nucleoid-associated protein YgaU
MNNRMVCPVMLLVGIGIGAAVGILISKPKIDKAQTEIDQLQTQMQLDKTNSEDTIQKAATEIARTKKELMQAKGLISKLMVQLSNAKTELSKFETQPSAATDTTEPETVVLGQPTKAPATPSNISTKEYVVKEGDSPWVIAERELGSGIRFKEILELNGMTEDQPLKIGTTLKIPTQ